MTFEPPSPSKVTQLQDSGLGVKKEVLGLYISMTHPVGMDIGQGAKQLVHVELFRKHKKKPVTGHITGIQPSLSWNMYVYTQQSSFTDLACIACACMGEQ